MPNSLDFYINEINSTSEKLGELLEVTGAHLNKSTRAKLKSLTNQLNKIGIYSSDGQIKRLCNKNTQLRKHNKKLHKTVKSQNKCISHLKEQMKQSRPTLSLGRAYEELQDLRRQNTILAERLTKECERSSSLESENAKLQRLQSQLTLNDGHNRIAIYFDQTATGLNSRPTMYLNSMCYELSRSSIAFENPYNGTRKRYVFDFDIMPGQLDD